MTKNTRQEKIDSLQCPECGNSHQCKMDCSSSHAFKVFKQALVWLPYMTNEQLALLNYHVWVEANERSVAQIEEDVEDTLKALNEYQKKIKA